jgi:hypothetical protein
MSADLLAAFGTGVTPADSNSHADSNNNKASQLEPANSFDDDDFDSFVSPEPSHAAQQDFHVTASESAAHNRSNQNASYFDTSKEDLWLPSEPGGEVLFDAALEETAADEDDWGEFEAAQNTASNQLLDLDSGNRASVASSVKANRTASKTTAPFDLLSLDDSLPLKKQAPVSNHGPRKLPSLASPQAKVSRSTPALRATPKVSPEDDFFGEWDDFKDGHEESKKPRAKEVTASKQKQSNTNILNHSKKSSISEVNVRPTNIPPPSVILQVLPSVLESFREQVNQSKRKSGAPSQDLITSLVSTLKATSRVVAGRSQRWKRDTRLSQSMKIGPAGSGKTSGMKLSSVSKGENIKEEQEVVTVIESWRNHTASLNSFIQSSGGRPIPVIADKSRVDTASPEDGALKASHACALCGLKRDERLPKIDEDIQDSFGDWWTEHWGHTDCNRFWEENSKHLSQR